MESLRSDNPSIVPDLSGAHLQNVRLSRANLAGARCQLAYFGRADLTGADLSGSDLSQAYLRAARLSGAVLRVALAVETELSGADLTGGRLAGANLTAARLRRSDLSSADLQGATLKGADLRQVIAVGTMFKDADLSCSQVYGISAWSVDLRGATQFDLVITPDGESSVTTDDLAIAQFLYLLLQNESIRNVVEAVGKKAVLILGRFSIERKPVLDAVRKALRLHDFVPILFDFERPHNRDLTETVSTLAHLSRAVVVDLTDARSVPQELMAIVPSLPSVMTHPIVADSATEYATFEHLARYPWVADVFRYSSLSELVAWLPGALGATTGDGIRLPGRSFKA